jgi:hypothetical protein
VNGRPQGPARHLPERSSRIKEYVMHKRIVPLAALALLLTTGASTTVAQSGTMTCGLAVSRLQDYVTSVNAFANGEFYQGIPMRCGWNQWCRNYWYGQLNAWYAQQSVSVNSWYRQLVSECTAEDNRPNKKRVDLKRSRGDDPGGLDEEAVEDLEVDEVDKTVRIRIPSDARGYRP